jgi:hypothetical protein
VSEIENPPAFPFSYRMTDAAGGEHECVHDGMSLRDWFAGQAIGAVIRQCAGDCAFGYPEGIESIEQMFAVKSYAIADALLTARKTGEGK